MKVKHYKNDPIWQLEFKNFLKHIFKIYNIDYNNFCDTYKCSTSTIRYWLCGRNLPQRELLFDLKEFIINNISKEQYHRVEIHETVKNIFERNQHSNVFDILNSSYIDEECFVAETLLTLYCFAKKDFSLLDANIDKVTPTGKIQAVIFDFDGTLTCSKTNQTTWEKLWINLGYDVRLCQELHMKYNRNVITHSKWCKLTEERFRKRKLNKTTLDEIAKNIRLINGIEETFKELESKNIKMYIVSGSILYIIKSVLGNLSKYINETKANIFKFDDNGYLTEIVGTKYDFEGKATYIGNVASELNIAPEDILFVGNSINDRFAYISRAKTLCINPQLTDTSNIQIWNECIPTCEDLTEILKFV